MNIEYGKLLIEMDTLNALDFQTLLFEGSKSEKSLYLKAGEDAKRLNKICDQIKAIPNPGDKQMEFFLRETHNFSETYSNLEELQKVCVEKFNKEKTTLDKTDRQKFTVRNLSFKNQLNEFLLIALAAERLEKKFTSALV